MKRRFALSVATTLLLTGGAFAQNASSPPIPAVPAPPAAQTTPAAPSQGSAPAQAHGALSAEGRKFVAEATEAGADEVAMGRLALKRSSNPRIREFAQRMIDDHGKANQDLLALVRSHGGQPPDDTHERARPNNRLAQVNSRLFDRRYIRLQVQDHQKAVSLFEREASSGNDAALKQFAHATLPVLRDHLAMAQSIAAEIAPQASYGDVRPGAGGATRPSKMAPSGVTADQLNEAEYERVHRASGQSMVQPRAMAQPQSEARMATGLCGPHVAQVGSMAQVQPGSQPGATKPPDTNTAAQRAMGC